MMNQKFIIDSNSIDDEALTYYRKLCEASRLDNSFVEEGISLRNNVKKELHIKALVSYYVGPMIKEENLYIHHIKIRCKVLGQIKDVNLLGVYIYLITLGDTNIQKDNIMDQYFYSMWESAYLDATRDYLRSILQRDSLYLSDSFGPGYYGMDINETKNIFQLFDASQIQVSLKDGNCMIPMNSNLGIFLETETKLYLPIPCQSCLGNPIGCSLCNRLI